MAGTYSILLAGLKTSEESFISNHFARSGHRIVAARDIADAKEKLKIEKIDFIYLQASANDTSINELDEIAGHSPAPPTVLICAQPGEGLVLDAWHAGAADILFPPLTSESLDTSLERGAKQLISRQLEQTTMVPARFFYLDETGRNAGRASFPPNLRLAAVRAAT